jgi:TPR repeat protein
LWANEGVAIAMSKSSQRLLIALVGCIFFGALLLQNSIFLLDGSSTIPDANRTGGVPGKASARLENPIDQWTGSRGMTADQKAVVNAQSNSLSALFEQRALVPVTLRVNQIASGRDVAAQPLEQQLANSQEWVAKAKAGDNVAAYVLGERLGDELVFVDPATQRQVLQGKEAHRKWMPKDEPIEPEHWYRLAAQRGDALAALKLSSILRARGLSSDPSALAESRQWLEFAAHHGLDMALYWLGVSYQVGNGGSVNATLGHAYQIAFKVVSGESQDKVRLYLDKELRPGEQATALSEATRILRTFGRG